MTTLFFITKSLTTVPLMLTRRDIDIINSVEILQLENIMIHVHRTTLHLVIFHIDNLHVLVKNQIAIDFHINVIVLLRTHAHANSVIDII